jgi:uncharacterized phage infection (PIP) family protein YhgE
LACTGPAFSQTVVRGSSAQPGPIVLPKVLSDPATANRLADAIQSLSTALLDLNVGNLQATGGKISEKDRNLTVRDLVRQGDPNADREIEQQIAQARPKIEQGIRAMNDALPQINSDLEQARKAIERAVANIPDPDYPKR